MNNDRYTQLKKAIGEYEKIQEEIDTGKRNLSALMQDTDNYFNISNHYNLDIPKHLKGEIKKTLASIFMDDVVHHRNEQLQLTLTGDGTDVTDIGIGVKILDNSWYTEPSNCGATEVLRFHRLRVITGDEYIEFEPIYIRNIEPTSIEVHYLASSEDIELVSKATKVQLQYIEN